MAVKTITIDMEAYEILAAEKRPNESFSKVIKRRLKARHTGADVLRSLADVEISEEALDGMDKVIDARKASPAASELWGDS